MDQSSRNQLIPLLPLLARTQGSSILPMGPLFFGGFEGPFFSTLLASGFGIPTTWFGIQLGCVNCKPSVSHPELNSPPSHWLPFPDRQPDSPLPSGHQCLAQSAPSPPERITLPDCEYLRPDTPVIILPRAKPISTGQEPHDSPRPSHTLAYTRTRAHTHTYPGQRDTSWFWKPGIVDEPSTIIQPPPCSSSFSLSTHGHYHPSPPLPPIHLPTVQLSSPFPSPSRLVPRRPRTPEMPMQCNPGYLKKIKTAKRKGENWTKK